MNSPAQDIRIILEADSSLGLVFGTDLFIGLMPDSPDACASIADSGGFPASPGPYYYPTAQVLVRGIVGSYAATSAVAADVVAALHEYTGQPDSSSYFYAGIWSMYDPIFIGVDEKNRPLFSMNFRIQRR